MNNLLNKKSINRISKKQGKIKQARSLLRELLIILRGSKCEICGKPSSNLTLFHILPVGMYPRIQLHARNVLLACWIPCHNDYHTDSFKRKKIERKIKLLRGDNYYEELKLIDHKAFNLTLEGIEQQIKIFRQSIKELKK